MLKKYLSLLALLFLLVAIITVASQGDDKVISDKPVQLTVYKTPTCGCCKQWVSHIEANGINTVAKNFSDVSFIKNKHGIKPEYHSCHTAVSSNGFVFEGHVPAKFVKQFLSEKHKDTLGLSVPAMPMGSPGMEMGGNFTPYDILMLLKNGETRVYARVKTYQDQF